MFAGLGHASHGLITDSPATISKDVNADLRELRVLRKRKVNLRPPLKILWELETSERRASEKAKGKRQRKIIEMK